MERISWDELHFTSAILWAQRSLDPSSQVGCAIVGQDNVPLAYGYNGPCRGVDLTHEQWHDKPFKYMWVEHGERNAIYNANKRQISLEGAKLYIVGLPCTDCARAIIQTGVKDVFVLKAMNDIWITNPSWTEKMHHTVDMFSLAGVNCQINDTNIVADFNIRISGKLYRISGTRIYEIATPTQN